MPSIVRGSLLLPAAAFACVPAVMASRTSQASGQGPRAWEVFTPLLVFRFRSVLFAFFLAPLCFPARFPLRFPPPSLAFRVRSSGGLAAVASAVAFAARAGGIAVVLDGCVHGRRSRLRCGGRGHRPVDVARRPGVMICSIGLGTIAATTGLVRPAIVAVFAVSSFFFLVSPSLPWPTVLCAALRPYPDDIVRVRATSRSPRCS